MLQDAPSDLADARASRSTLKVRKVLSKHQLPLNNVTEIDVVEISAVSVTANDKFGAKIAVFHPPIRSFFPLRDDTCRKSGPPLED